MEVEDLVKAFETRDAALMAKLAALEVKATSISQKTDDTTAMLADIEQKMVRGDHSGGGMFGSDKAGKSLGELFVSSPSFKAFQAIPEQSRKGHTADVITKATITSLTTDAAGSAGAGVQRDFAAIDRLPQRRLTVRDILPQVQMNSGSVDVPVEKAFTNAAATVAEAAEKPASDLQLELKNFPARVIAHHVKASRQILDDVPQLKGLIDGELLYGLKYVEDNQLLNGGGTGQDLNGLYTQAQAYAAPITLDAGAQNKIDVIGLALLQSALALFPPDAIILNPADWLDIRLIKSADGEYLFGPPGAVVQPRLFGLPVVETPAMTVDKFLVGEFQRAATIFDRWEARVETGFVNDDFIKNLVTILAEERLALAVKRPAALFKGDFSDALAA